MPRISILMQTRSQLIKAGVKLLIQNKRKHSVSTSSNDQPPVKQFIPSTYTSSPATTPTSSVAASEVCQNNNNNNNNCSSKVQANTSCKTDSTTSGDEDSESKQSTGTVGVSSIMKYNSQTNW